MNKARRAVRELAVVLLGAVCGCGDSALQDEYILSDQDLVPESGIYDPGSGAFYVGSSTKGNITRVDADGTESIFYAPPSSETWRTTGVTVDAAARRLWVCAQEGTPGEIARRQIWVFDLTRAELAVELDLDGAAERSTCNDIAVDGEGLAYVSDSANPRVYRANAADEMIEVWADDPLLDSDVSGIFGGNGIAVTDNDQYVLLSKTILSTATPRLLRIERANPTNISGITTTPEVTMTADGISFLDGDLYVAAVGSGEIFRLTSADQWMTATVTTSMQQIGTSTVRPAEGDLYGIYSDITNALLGQPINPPFRIYRIDLASFE